MQVILLEKIDNLGALGETVTVKSGFARNFLLPQGKALRATQDNIAYFEAQKKTIEAENATKKTEAEKTAKKISGLTVPIIRAAAESGKLYGSVSSRDVADAIIEKSGVKIDRNQVVINQAFKMLGLFPLEIQLHPEVKEVITINIARSLDEAQLQEKKGSALVVAEEETIEEAKTEAKEEIAAEKASDDADEAKETKAKKEDEKKEDK